MQLKRTIAALGLIAFTAALSPSFALAPKDLYHVMWTTEDGKAKCSNKGSKEKADRCAGKMRSKGKASNVQVMAGRCADM